MKKRKLSTKGMLIKALILNFFKKPIWQSINLMRYPFFAKKLKINDNIIVMEAQHGKEISGNIFYLLKSLREDSQYDKYTIYLTCQKSSKKKILSILNQYNIKNVNVVLLYSTKYIKAMASAKYLFNDNTFLPFYIKKEGQVYLNTWHGTPLKTLGKGIKNALHGIGNTQKNFVCADYLLYPNRYTMEHMTDDYMLQNIATGEAILSGYPRNAVFFDENRRKEVIDELNLQGKKIYAYMPTWRGTVDSVSTTASDEVQGYLAEIDSKLRDDEILFVNLHPIARKNVDFSNFKKIKTFPSQYETYDFLNCAECLVTDYSSVFYDYANTKKKIILFAYDEEEYFADRGVYKPLSSLPFPNVKTTDDLITELRSPKNYDDTEFLSEYCAFDNKKASTEVLSFVLNGKKSEFIREVPFKKNGKKNILLYLGNMDKNGVTTAGTNLLKTIDKSENNYFVTFTAMQAKFHQDSIAALPEDVSYFPIQGMFNLNIFKKVLWLAYNCKLFPMKPILKLLKNEWKPEIHRLFGGAHFDSVIQFTGYTPKMILMFSEFPCTKTIYVHSDMQNEIKYRGNQRRNLLEYAYKKYDNVALVTPDIWDATASFTDNTDNFKITHNIIAAEEIKSRGEKEIHFDPDVTESNKTEAEVNDILDSDAKVFISVGRYSPEKAHKRMINAFNTVWEENNNTYLIIIGGNERDNLYKKLCEYVKTLPCKENVVLILSMSNPMPIVKKCDGFILGSLYEGFGLVLAEADILGLPVVSTDIVGPRTFMQKYNGTLVENSDKGMVEGFKLLLEGKVPPLTVDYDEYNREAVNEFKQIL